MSRGRLGDADQSSVFRTVELADAVGNVPRGIAPMQGASLATTNLDHFNFGLPTKCYNLITESWLWK
jgi:hypothetical protein